MNKSELADKVFLLAQGLFYRYTYTISKYFRDILGVIIECTDTDCHVEEAKLTMSDLQWTHKKLKEIERTYQLLENEVDSQVALKVQEGILSDERWKHYEVGRVYLTRYDCCIVPGGARRLARLAYVS